MKKFLTVLLVIAVMFTFSFGSAFAAAPAPVKQLTPDQVIEKITDAADALKANVLKAKNDALYSIFGAAETAEVAGVEISKATVEKIYNSVVYDAAIAAIDAKLETKLQAVQTAMNPTGGKVFSGYFVVEGESAVEDTVNGVTYVYPAYDTVFTDVAFTITAGGASYTWYAHLIEASHFTMMFDNTASGYYAGKVGVQAFKDVKAATLAAIRAIDLDAYSKEYKGEAKSNYDLATALVAAAINTINPITVAADANWATATSAITSITDVYKAGENQADATGTLAVGGLLTGDYSAIGLNDLTTLADEPTEEAKLEWAKAQVLAGVTKLINEELAKKLDAQDDIILNETLKGAKGNASVIAKAKEAKEEAQELAAAALDVLAYHVNYGEALTDFIVVNPSNFAASTTLVYNAAGYLWHYTDAGLDTPYVDGTDAAPYWFSNAELLAIAEAVAELKEEAEILKASVAIDGAEYVAIEKALENALEDTYLTGTKARLAGFDAQQVLWDRQNALNGTGTVKIADRKYVAVSDWFGALENINDETAKNTGVYEEQFYDELRAVEKETKAAVNAAQTIEAAEEAFLAGLAKFDAIKTMADRNAAQAGKDFADLKAKYTAELTAYMTYKVNTIANLAATTDYSWNNSTMLSNLLDEFDAAYTVEELTAAYEAGKAEIDGLKTKAELLAAKKALDDRAKAYTTTTVVTVADKEVVGTLLADIEDHNDYCDLIGNTAQKVVVTYGTNHAYNKIQELEADAIEAAIKAIGTVTVEDEAAIKDVQAQLDAYVAYYAGEDAEDSEIAALKGVNYLGTTVAELQADLNAAKVRAWNVMVGKLPADGSDVEGIKAARAAYEDLTRGGKISVYRTAAYDKLLDLEKISGINADFAAKEAIAAVEGLKITAKSSAKKGSITVKWTVEGDDANVDYYEVRKSTKKNSGFGTKPYFTTEKTSYKNTKGLKKGTRYYFKVRAVAEIDGVVYTSDWSNKAYRVAK